MRVQFCKAVVAVAMGSALAVGTGPDRAQQPPAAQQAKPDWKDRQEYDLYQLIDKETDPQKKLELLKQWTEKYPNTAFQELRLSKYLETYLATKDAAGLYQTAKALVQLNPKSFQGLYWTCILTVSQQQTSADALKTGEQAANGLLGVLDEVFAADKKPATMAEDAWKKARTDSEALGHRTLGWIAMPSRASPVLTICSISGRDMRGIRICTNARSMDWCSCMSCSTASATPTRTNVAGTA